MCGDQLPPAQLVTIICFSKVLASTRLYLHMSIEITGRKGYRFQDLATLWISLLAECENPRSTSLQVEAREDAELQVLTLNGCPLHLAMQSKYQEGDFSLAILAEWLAHFDPRDASTCLLHRLRDTPNTTALFITKREHSDATKPWKRAPGQWDPLPNGAVKKRDIEAICDELAQLYSDPDTRLTKDRAVSVKTLSQELRDRSMLPLWHRVVVWNEISEEIVQHKLSDLLRQWRIPVADTDFVLRELLDVIEAALPSRGEIMPQIRQVLKEHDVGRILASPHTHRQEQSELARTLEAERVIWLTGQRQSGKTHLGRCLLSRYQDSGHDCLVTQDLVQARQFLSDKDLETKVVLLDDPFPEEKRQAVFQFSKTMPRHHLMVVTSRRDVLSDLLLQTQNGRPLIDSLGVRWHDLTTKDREFLLGCWKQQIAESLEAGVVSPLVEQHLATAPDDELLQPGQLCHLAKHWEPTMSPNMDTVLRLARFIANELAHSLFEQDAEREMQIVLGIGAATVRGISERELAFMSSKDADQPGMRRHDGIRSLKLGGPNPTAVFPEYQVRPVLSEANRGILRRYERQGYLMRVGDRWSFTHPDYREAFQRRVLLESGSGVADVERVLRRAFDCLAPSQGLSACTFMSLALARLQSQGQTSKGWIEATLEAAKQSRFPEVCEEAIEVFLADMGSMTLEEQNLVMQVAKRLEQDVWRIVWEGGTLPWIQDSDQTMTDSLFRTRRKLPDETLRELITELSTLGSSRKLTGREADALNSALLPSVLHRGLDYVPGVDLGTISTAIFHALLDREEAFIRADAAEVIVTSGAAADPSLRDKIFGDRHPLVLASAIEALFKRWPAISENVRVALRPHVTSSMESPVVAAITSAWFVRLGDDTESERSLQYELWDDTSLSEFWNMWAACAVPMLRGVARNRVYFNAGLMHCSAMEAAKWLPNELFSGLAMSWMEWIEGQLLIAAIDDYGLSVLDLFLESHRELGTLRKEIVKRMLAQPSTDVAGMAVQTLVRYWSRFTEEERALVIAVLGSRRTDREWLQAIALTRAAVPSEIAEVTTGRADFFALSPAAKRTVLGPSLLARCIRILTRPPGRGLMFEVASEATSSWINILNTSLWHLDVPLHPIAMAHLLECMSLQGFRGHLASLWIRLCAKSDREGRANLFDALRRAAISSTYPKLRGAWRMLLASAEGDEELDTFADQAADVMEALSLSRNDPGSLEKQIGEDFFERLLRRSIGDFFVWRALRWPRDTTEDKIGLQLALQAIELVYQHSSPRLLMTHEVIEDLLSRLDTDDVSQLLEKVEKARRVTIQVGSDQRDRFRHSELGLDGWLCPDLDGSSSWP